MTASRPARLARAFAVLLALVAVGAALRSLTLRRELTEDERLLARLARGLVALQGADGAFDPDPGDPRLAEVLRTIPHALATAALARARRLDLADEVPGLERALERALDVLAARQKPGGGFGGLAPDAGNRWPGVEAMGAGALAFLHAARPRDREVLRAALAALERSAAYELRDGYTRALVAMAFHAARATGADGLLGRDLPALLQVAEDDPEADCRDEQVAEAIVRRVKGLSGDFGEAVLESCTAREPAWVGERSDLEAWWMQAWLAARSPRGGPFLGLLREALDEGLEAPPAGRIGGGWYADEITQTACAALGLAEALAPLDPPSPR